MTSCELLSNRMVAVAAGLDAWTDEESRHLSVCADCGAEWRLVRQGRELGARLPTLDLDRVAGGVRARLAAGPAGQDARVVPIGSRRRGFRWLVGLATAAAVILAAWYANIRTEPAGESGAALVLTELEGLTSSELEMVLTGLEAPSVPDGGRLGDLSADELEQVLRSWES